MSGRTHLLAVALAAAFAGGGAAASRLQPLPPQEAVSTHSPFEMGECHLCHERNDRASPGKVTRAPPQLCTDCHDDMTGIKRSHPSRGNCTGCHSPHNARKRKLLL